VSKREERPKSFINRLVVKMGRPDGSEGYEIEFEFPYGTTIEEFEDARQKGLNAMRAWLGQKPTAAPQLDPKTLEGLPWKPYKEGHRAGWVFTDKAEQLAEAIRHSEEGKVTVGEFEYKFSGPKDGNPTLFISRTPIEPEKGGG